MRSSRFKEEQIIAILREQEAGTSTADVCRESYLPGCVSFFFQFSYVSFPPRYRLINDVPEIATTKGSLGNRIFHPTSSAIIAI